MTNACDQSCSRKSGAGQGGIEPIGGKEEMTKWEPSGQLAEHLLSVLKQGCLSFEVHTEVQWESQGFPSPRRSDFQR